MGFEPTKQGEGCEGKADQGLVVERIPLMEKGFSDVVCAREEEAAKFQGSGQLCAPCFLCSALPAPRVVAEELNVDGAYE